MDLTLCCSHCGRPKLDELQQCCGFRGGEMRALSGPDPDTVYACLCGVFLAAWIVAIGLIVWLAPHSPTIEMWVCK